MSNSFMIDALGRSSTERDELRAKVEKLNKIAFDNWDDPAWRREAAATITQTIYRGFEHENLLQLMAEVENAPFDGRVTIKETKGLKAFWVARGGYIEESTLRSEVMEIPRDIIGFHVSELEDKLRTNFAETQATLVDLGIQRMDAEINLRFLGLLQAAIPDGSSQHISSAGFSLAALNAALREVRDETRDFAGVSIIGRATMTDQIMEELVNQGTNTGFTPTTNEDVLRRGVLGVYRGAKIIVLNNYKDADEKSFFPANEMYVVSRDATKMAFWGGMQAKEWVENDSWYWHYMAKREFGGVVHRPRNLRRIVDTSIPAY